nr:MAG TPA: hypothetical protein [Caudoviricetes sp.]
MFPWSSTTTGAEVYPAWTALARMSWQSARARST